MSVAQKSLTRLNLRARLSGLLSSEGFKEEYFLVALSILIGCATGAGAYLFYSLIEFATAQAYGHGTHGGLYHGRAFMLVVLPAAGALLVGFITRHFAREAKGHGVPEVMDAILRHGARIRPRVAIAKAASSALTIGSGGAAGTEGPIIQIGAAVGSSFGQSLGVHVRHMSVLVACGVAAGIAAIFNAPIAGVLFALEIFLRDFSFRTFSPVVFASVLGCSTMHALQGGTDVAIFAVQRPEEYVFQLANLPYYVVLGFLCALAAVAFIKVLYKTEDLFDAMKVPEQIKPMIGAIGLGIAGIVYLRTAGGTGTPAFFGNGYPAITAAISPTLLDFEIHALVVLLGFKLLATALTLGSGGSGGVFAPSLMIGAFLGGAFGLGLNKSGLVAEGSVTAFALVGMAAVTAGTTHAPLTAIVILYELTREATVILPIMFAAIVATAGARLISKDSIYTLKLRRRGIRFGTLADLTILKRITADQVRVMPPQFVHAEDPLQKLLQIADETDSLDFVVTDDDGNYIGLAVAYDIKTALLQPEAVPLLVVGELIRRGVPTVRPTETLDSVLDKFARCDVDALPLTTPHDARHVEGLITRQAVMSRYQQELDAQTG